MTAPCLGNPTPYDILIDDTRGPAFHAALAEARRMCGACPLAQMQACFKANRDEQWVRSIVGVVKAPRTYNTCGKAWGHKAHARHGEATCDDCKRADAEAQRHKRRPVAVCGTESGYTRHRRHGEDACDACREAHRIMSALREKRKREAA